MPLFKSATRKIWSATKKKEASFIKRNKLAFKEDFGPSIDAVKDALTAKSWDDAIRLANASLTLAKKYRDKLENLNVTGTDDTESRKALDNALLAVITQLDAAIEHSKKCKIQASHSEEEADEVFAEIEKAVKKTRPKPKLKSDSDPESRRG